MSIGDGVALEKIREGGLNLKETVPVCEGGWRTASALAVRALIGRNPFIIH